MTTPADAGFDFAIPVDRWAVRLDEPTPEPTAADASGSVPLASNTEPEPLPFPLEVPGDGFEPRLLRFGEAA